MTTNTCISEARAISSPGKNSPRYWTRAGNTSLQRNYVDGVITTPKSGKSRRVAISLQLIETLKVLLTERKKETLKKGRGEVPSWVFTSATGTMMDPDNFRHRVWSKLPAKAELRQIRIHDLRHTFASLLIQQGAS